MAIKVSTMASVRRVFFRRCPKCLSLAVRKMKYVRMNVYRQAIAALSVAVKIPAPTPPMMITIVIIGRMAFRRICTHFPCSHVNSGVEMTSQVSGVFRYAQFLAGFLENFIHRTLSFKPIRMPPGKWYLLRTAKQYSNRLRPRNTPGIAPPMNIRPMEIPPPAARA